MFNNSDEFAQAENLAKINKVGSGNLLKEIIQQEI
ncbi:hypothetical protein L950_0203170 [Sphingobacterium sp. IITKGP-BTPF85]|nr:hypothetical protein L950_0203170 [Sphingobacterium sp. IITKGP-BTPF85]